jgi:hypothetical protein
MRFLKRTTVNPRDPRDARMYVDVTSNVVMTGRASLQLPKGSTSDRPVAAIPTSLGATPGVADMNGMIRYNTTTDEVEVYQSGTWRALRFKEASGITQQLIGTGNGATTYFGVLNPAPPATVQSGFSWGAQNIIVLIENVVQISTTNYDVVQNPTPTLTATGTNLSGATTINVTPTNNAATNFTNTLPNIKAGATVTATVLGSPAFAANTTVQTVGTSSFTINNATLQAIPPGTTITITLPSGYYVNFTSPATLSKSITVLHGFDK